MDIPEFFNSLDAKLKALPDDEFISAAQAEMETLTLADRAIIEKYMVGYIEDGLKSVVANCVVILMHGIRDHATWHEKLRENFNGNSSIAKTYSARFEFFDAWDFVRYQAKLESILEGVEAQIKNILDNHERQRVIMRAHSFGTYLLSLLFQAGSVNKADGVIFCGSIVPASYNWSGLNNPLKAPVVNECGLLDNWPLVAHSLFASFGTAGRIGFVDGVGARNRYHICGHGDFFSEDFVNKHWLPYIVRGRVDSAGVDRPQPSWLLTLICNERFTKIFQFICIPLAILMTLSLGYLIWIVIKTLWGALC